MEWSSPRASDLSIVGKDRFVRDRYIVGPKTPGKDPLRVHDWLKADVARGLVDPSRTQAQWIMATAKRS